MSAVPDQVTVAGAMAGFVIAYAVALLVSRPARVPPAAATLPLTWVAANPGSRSDPARPR